MAADIWVPIGVGMGFGLAALYVATSLRHHAAWILGVILLVFCSELNFAHVFQILSTDLTAKIFWYKMVYIGFTVTPSAFFCLSLRYAGYGSWLTNRNRLLISSIPALTAALVLTNELHGLLWKPELTTPIVYSSGFLNGLSAGIWYWIFLGYSYLMMGLGFFVLAWLSFHSKKIYGLQSASLITAGVLAVLGTTLDVINLSPLPSFTTTAIGFAIGTITTAFILNRIRRQGLIAVSHTTIINSISDSILVLDVDNLVVDLNPAALRLLAIPSALIIGRPILTFVPQLGSFLQVYDDITQELVLNYENSPHTFDMRISAIKDWRNQLVSKVVVLRDITDRKQAEQDLRRATEGTRAIFWRAIVTKTDDPALGDGGYIWDIHYSNLDKVNEFLPLQMVPGGDLADRFFYSRMEEDRIRMHEVCTNALNNGADGYTQEFRIRDAQGAIHWMYENARIQKLNENQFEILGFITDLTERKMMEEALRESEARLSIFFEHEPTCKLIIHNKTRIISDVNPSALELIGLTKESIVGKVCHGFLCPAHAGSCPICDLGQGVYNSEWVLIKGDGSTIPILKTVVPIKIKEEDYLLESFVDISEQKKAKELIEAQNQQLQAQNLEMLAQEKQIKQAYDTLNRLNNELEERVIHRTQALTQANAEMESFSYSVSHDLRAPLRIINGFGQLLLEDFGGQLDEVGKDYLRKIRASSARMGQLIDDLLKLSRINRREMNYGKVNLSQIANQVAQSLNESDPGRQVAWSIAPDVFVYGDESMLRDALENLLSNAWKFTAFSEQPAIEFGFTRHDGQIAYFIRDNGAGFNPAHSDKLFEPFARMHDDKDFEGTGIGLSIVKRIVTHHRGKIWAVSEVNKGAVFYFTLGQI